jgi:hypothetical protein
MQYHIFNLLRYFYLKLAVDVVFIVLSDGLVYLDIHYNNYTGYSAIYNLKIWGVPVNQMFATGSLVIPHVDSIMPVDSYGEELFIFCADRVYTVDVSTDYRKWNVVAEEPVGTGTGIWSNAPHGIVAAAWTTWLVGGGFANSDGKAVLFTRDYFVLYNTATKTVVYRGQFCP